MCDLYFQKSFSSILSSLCIIPQAHNFYNSFSFFETPLRLRNAQIHCAKLLYRPSPPLSALVSEHIALPNPKSQEILLLCRPRILIHMPFDITALLRQRATTNLKQAHRHPGAHLSQLDRLPARPYKHMVPHLDAVGDVLKSHNAAANFLIRGRGLARRKQMFKDLHHTFAERSVEVVEYEVRVGF